MGILIGPVILSLGIINFNAFIGTVIATLISIPSPAIIERAFRLFQLPSGDLRDRYRHGAVPGLLAPRGGQTDG